MSPAFIEKDAVVNAGKTTQIEVRVRPTGAIGGSVENVSTDALLKGVRIQLLDERGTVLQDTQTGDDGTFRFVGLHAGAYNVRMILPKGYIAEGETERTLNVAGGGEARADFQVYRHGAVEGRVLTEDGAPIGDAEVSIVDSTGAVLRTVRTDPNGVFSFPDMPVDKYRVRVNVPESMSA